jgi:hypothetical protein
MLTSDLYSGIDDEQRKKVHEGAAREAQRLVDTSLVVGALSLAAWVTLFVVDTQAPSNALNPAGRDLLLVGAAILIATPTFFRVPDRYVTFLARDAGVYLGLTSVGLFFASLAADLIEGWPGVTLAITGSSALALRDFAGSVRELKVI